MASSVRHTGGAYVRHATLPTMTGAFTIQMWFKCPSAGYVAGDHCFFSLGNTGASSEGLFVSLGADNVSVDAFAFRNGGSDFQPTTILTGSDTGWICVMFRHAAGSSTYRVSTRRENVTTWTTVSLTMGGQITATGGAIRIGSNEFDEHVQDSDSRAYFVQQSELSDADALTASQAINSAPAGTNLHWFRLLDAASAATSTGTAGNGTTSGSLSTDTSEPTETLPATATSDMLRVRQRAKGFPPRAPLPGIARLGIGLLVAQASLSPISATLSGSGDLTATLSSVPLAGMPQPQPQPMAYSTAIGIRYPGPPRPVLGSGLLSSTPSSTSAIVATCAGIGGFSGTISATGALAGTLPGVGAEIGTATAMGALAGSCSGTGSFAGTAQAQGAAAATIAGVGALSGTATAPGALAGSCAGAGALSGALLQPGANASCAGTGGLSGTLAALGGASATCAGTGVLSCTASAPGALAGSAAGVGSVSATVSAVGALAGSSAGVGALTGSLVLGAAAGTCVGTGSLSGTLGAVVSIAGSSAGSGGLTGTVTAPGALAASCSGVGSLSATGDRVASGTCSMAGVGGLSGTTAPAGSLVGTIAGAGALSGSLSGDALIACTMLGVGSLTATVNTGFVRGDITHRWRVVAETDANRTWKA